MGKQYDQQKKKSNVVFEVEEKEKQEILAAVKVAIENFGRQTPEEIKN